MSSKNIACDFKNFISKGENVCHKMQYIGTHQYNNDLQQLQNYGL